jgi:hypothetical protein
MPNVDLSHGLSTGLITVATAKGWSMWNGNDVPMQPMLEAGLACGASAVVVDTLLGNSGMDPMMKAVATGAVLSGAMMAWKNDQHFEVWIPVGAVSYYLSDWAMKAFAKAKSDKLGANGAGQRQQGPVVPGM